MKEINGIKLYTTAELAQLLGVSVPTVRNYIKRGNITKTRIGRADYVSEENISNYLNGRK